MARDDFSLAVKNALKMRAALICSNPDCRKQTVAPSELDECKFVSLGKAAHITAAATGGPRYDASLSAIERAAISNAIYLCSSCADLVDKNNGMDFPVAILKAWKEEHERWVFANLNKQHGGMGEGGSGTIIGNRGTIIGGKGGSGGGKGGGGFILGDDGVIIGGDAGNCGTADGRGGKGGRGPTERLGFPTFLWGFGRGGCGNNQPEYNRRIRLLAQFRTEYKAKFPDDAQYIDAGVDVVPTDWINQRLIECGEAWQVELGENGYLLPSL